MLKFLKLNISNYINIRIISGPDVNVIKGIKITSVDVMKLIPVRTIDFHTLKSENLFVTLTLPFPVESICSSEQQSPSLSLPAVPSSCTPPGTSSLLSSKEQKRRVVQMIVQV